MQRQKVHSPPDNVLVATEQIEVQVLKLHYFEGQVTFVPFRVCIRSLEI